MDDDDDVARPHRSSGASLILELARGARTEMDDAALRRRRPSGSNRAKAAVLTSALKKRGAVSSPEVAAAFARVDRSVSALQRYHLTPRSATASQRRAQLPSRVFRTLGLG